MVVPGLEISATTVMRNVRKNEWNMEIAERKEENKIKAKYIYIQVDEDHIKQRNKKGCTISKIVTIYTRKRTLTKPDRIEEVQQIRKELVDKFTFSGLYKDNQKLWEDVAYYIDCTYKKDEIENIFIMGDGASYIKAGVEWIEKSVFVLDLFHLKKYINHLNYDEYLNELKGKLKKSEERLQKECEGLSKIRKKEAKLLQAKIAEGLQDLNFLDVCFEIRFSKTSGYTVEGTDEVEFMISMNPGEPTRPLATVASGGELSRIMLAIKAVMADKDEIETLIFDEIDVGISGRTAQKVSEKMCLIGRKHQVICITHLAQIAAMADTHYLIEKRVEDQMTKTKIRQLDREESVQELGRILGGAKITDAVLENAREMKILASGLKK